MPIHIALLRSVNVAGHGRLAMADLQESFRTLGYSDVSTYIQTGNVIFSTSTKSAKKLVADIEAQLARDFGHSPAVLLRTPADLRRVVLTSPYQAQGADPSRHHVTFLATTPDVAHLSAFTAPSSGRDELRIIGQEIYVHTPDGYADTKLTGAMLERRLGVVTTTRNWNTVAKLDDLVNG
jgi:uncharacterized protein (DUF1697 family)